MHGRVEILCEAALVNLHLAVGYAKDTIADLRKEMTVMAHDNDCAFEILQRVGENLSGADVEVVGRFVEDDEVDRPH